MLSGPKKVISQKLSSKRLFVFRCSMLLITYHKLNFQFINLRGEFLNLSKKTPIIAFKKSLLIRLND